MVSVWPEPPNVKPEGARDGMETLALSGTNYGNLETSRFAVRATMYVSSAVTGAPMRKILVSAFVLLLFICSVREVCAASDQMGEPFGLDEFVAPENSPTWQQWKKIIADAQAELRRLERCRTGSDTCNAAEWRLAAMVREARGKDGRAKIEFVNGLINGAIRYQSDKAHWGIPDSWSLPVDTHNDGSLDAGAGDCEDFVLAKYAVLHQAGVSDEDLRIVLVHDNAVRQDHAVLAVRHDGQWLILDNRWNNLFKDKDEELRQFKPLMIVTRNGVWVLSKMFRIGDVVAPSNATSANAEFLQHRLISPSGR